MAIYLCPTSAVSSPLDTAVDTQVGQAMSAPDATKEVQAQILGHFTQQLMRPALSQRETAVAVEAVGALAASTSRFFGEQVQRPSRCFCGGKQVCMTRLPAIVYAYGSEGPLL